MSKKSLRLEVIKNLVPKHSKILWDICCDHGQLGLMFTDLDKIYFLDQIPSIMKTLETFILKNDFKEHHELICHDARSYEFTKTENTCYVICGVGADLAVKILSNLISKVSRSSDIILSVHKNTLKLRMYLKSMKFRVTSEVLVKDNEIFYEVLVVHMEKGVDIQPIGGPLWENPTAVHLEYLNLKIEYYSKKEKFSREYLSILESYKQVYRQLTK